MPGLSLRFLYGFTVEHSSRISMLRVAEAAAYIILTKNQQHSQCTLLNKMYFQDIWPCPLLLDHWIHIRQQKNLVFMQYFPLGILVLNTQANAKDQYFTKGQTKAKKAMLHVSCGHPSNLSICSSLLCTYVFFFTFSSIFPFLLHDCLFPHLLSVVSGPTVMKS